MSAAALRRIAVTVAAVLVGAAAGIGAIAFFSARDDSVVVPREAPAPPRPPAVIGDALPGNVVLAFRDPALEAPLRALAGDVGGPPSPELEAAGQAVLVREDPDAGAPVVARAGSRTQTANAADEPELRRFVERWLGRDPR